MRRLFAILLCVMPGLGQASSYLRVDVIGSVDQVSSAYSGPLDVAVGDAFSVTGYFDLSVLPSPTSTADRNSYRNIGVQMFASLGGYEITHGTPVSPVPSSIATTYANASVHDIDPPSSSGVGFNFSATSASLLNGFSPYYIAIHGRDDDSAGLGDLLFTADKFTAASLAEMEETRVDFSLRNGTQVLRFVGEVDSWTARYVNSVPSAPAVPLPGTGVLLAGALFGGAVLRRRGRSGAVPV